MREIAKNIRAFALIEVALALSVLGVLAYLTMPLLGKLQKWQNERTTNAHQVEVMEALAGYVLANKRLPCPSATTNGEALATCNNDTKVGFIPYKTLGIAKRTAKDGNHNWMTYVVEPNLTSDQIKWLQSPELNIDPKMVFCKTPSGGNFQLVDEFNTPCILAPDFLGVLIIAHGKSGGFALENGGTKPVNSDDADKIRNANRGGVFVTKSFINKGWQIFDDVILFASRNNLMGHYAKYPCR